MRVPFTKMHGAGNDFVVIDARESFAADFWSVDRIRHLASRHLGVGADQVLLVEKPRPFDGVNAQGDEAQFLYRIFNADGHEVEQCGNGARCFARFVLDRGLAQGPGIRVQTRAGLIEPVRLANNNIRVDMGRPRLDAADLPFETQGLASRRAHAITLYELDVSSSGELAWVAPVSMGNPHLVQWLEVAPTDKLIEDQGLWLQSHRRLPQRVNAGFARIENQSAIALRVFERGAGETLSCGTGACAAAVAGIAQGRLSSSVPVSVATRGGVLQIEWSGSLHDSVFLAGPAETVFEGVIEL